MADFSAASSGGIMGRRIADAGYGGEAAVPQVSRESQLERAARLCKSLSELHTRLNFINIKVRGQIPENASKDAIEKQPEVTLVNLSNIAEMYLERCHYQVNELAAQIGE